MAKTKTKSEVATAEQIATLIRIYRSAVTSGDHSLRRATVEQLAKHGIQTADLAAPDVTYSTKVTGHQTFKNGKLVDVVEGGAE